MNQPFPALDVHAVRKHFRTGRQVFSRGTVVPAVDDVSFEVRPGRVLGIVGESGSGKSTLANLLVGLEPLTGGEILIDGRGLTRRRNTALRRDVQMVFQDPFGSINPRFTVGRTVEEPLLIHRLGDAGERRHRAIAALEDAELRPGAAFFDRQPHELSGGQRQRVAIARAIVLRPKLLVADEPVSMLDVSVRAGILRLLRRLVSEGGMAMVFITHDLSIAGSICDDLAVMYRGRFVEYGPVLTVLRQPIHPYTAALIAAVPVPDPAVRPEPLPARLLAGASVAPSETGCRFHPRCGLAVPECELTPPPLAPILPDHVGRHRTDNHLVACHRISEIVDGYA
jgi:oligopeptide/dipeptide ABC transporter ATP-binding protein